MDDNGWNKTRRGRVTYVKKVKPFKFRDVRRILADLVIDSQLSNAERFALADLLYPPSTENVVPEDKISAFQELRDYLINKLFPDMELALPLVTWLVDLELDTVKNFLYQWVDKMRGRK